jgi:TPP-dependent 2-oxoacid decarboxylase
VPVIQIRKIASCLIVHPDAAPSMIDQVIRTALRERKPAYIEIACNLSDAPCPGPGPYEAILAPEDRAGAPQKHAASWPTPARAPGSPHMRPSRRNRPVAP